MTVLTVDNVSVARGGRMLLEDVSFTLAAGELKALRGGNGIGKSTLLRAIIGLLDPSTGTITLDRDDMVYGGHLDGIKPSLSVSENLSFWQSVYDGAAIDDALAAFDIADLTARIAGTLSAGQKRRLGLARLLVAKRGLWILDEPTVSLDAASVALFGEALKAHLSRGGAALVATHIDLGLPEDTIDLEGFRAAIDSGAGSFDEAFL